MIPSSRATVARRRLPKMVTRSLLAAWVALVLVVGAYTTGAHSLALLGPGKDDTVLESAVAGLRKDPALPLVVHALYAKCKCSQGIIDGLVARRRDARFEELVVLVGRLPDRERELSLAGYRLRHVGAAELSAQFHIEAAPTLIVTDRLARVRYAGGYQKTKAGPSLDRELLDRVAGGSVLERLPVLGCAVSRRLKALVDPLGLRDDGRDDS